MKKAFKIVILILWMSLIFFFSGQNGTASKQLSEGVLTFVASDYAGLEIFKVLIRKLAHFFLYFVLGILVEININNPKLSSFLCLIYALSDEIHQLFVPGRSFGFLDIILDGFSSVIGIVLLTIINKHRSNE